MTRFLGIVLIATLLALVVAACDDDDTGGPAANATPGGTSVDGRGPTVDCAQHDAPDEIDDAKLLIEFNSTDNDTGVHGLFDSGGFAELCVYAPDGSLILAVKPQGPLQDLGMGGIFFESREPAEDEVAQAATLDTFPEGPYTVRATTFDGNGLVGIATFTHDIPMPPVITFPEEGAVVDTDALVVTWEPVTQTLSGDPAAITSYEVIVTDDSDDAADPNGFARPVLSVHVPPSVSSLTIPSEFLQPGVEYELELIALEESGNQTITVLFFETA